MYERLALELAGEPLLPDEVDWRYPLQLFSGLHYLVLTGRASWDDVHDALRGEADFLREWVATERVQTNEPRRCWWLVPCFLEVARRTGIDSFDCLELGCSAGLNLLWDRYGYEYAGGVLEGLPAAFGYLGEDRRERARALLAAAECVFVHAGQPRDGSHDYYGLYVGDDEVAHAEFHGAWIEWLA